MFKNSFSLLLVFLAYTSFAQSKVEKVIATKIGYIQRDSVMFHLKEYDTNVKIFDAFQKQLSATLEVKQLELQSKRKDYDEKEKSLTVEQKQARMKELQKLEQDIKDFNIDAQQQLIKKQNDLLNPLNEKINKAIDIVANKNGYTHIADKKNFYFVAPAFDVTDLVTEEANKL